MSDDFLGFEDPDERKAAAGPALVPGARVGLNELLVQEEMHRKGSRDFPGAADMIFTMVDENGVETWDPPVPPDFKDEGVRWQRLMSWPRVPTVEEASQFQISARRALVAAWWDRLREAREADEAARPATTPRTAPQA